MPWEEVATRIKAFKTQVCLMMAVVSVDAFGMFVVTWCCVCSPLISMTVI
jgi:hypothetical protein